MDSKNKIFNSNNHLSSNLYILYVMIIMIQKNWMHFLGIMRRPRNKAKEKKAIISPNKKNGESDYR